MPSSFCRPWLAGLGRCEDQRSHRLRWSLILKLQRCGLRARSEMISCASSDLEGATQRRIAARFWCHDELWPSRPRGSGWNDHFAVAGEHWTAFKYGPTRSRCPHRGASSADDGCSAAGDEVRVRRLRALAWPPNRAVSNRRRSSSTSHRTFRDRSRGTSSWLLPGLETLLGSRPVATSGHG